MASEKEEYNIAELLDSLARTKEKNRKLLAQIADLLIENANLRARVEMYEAFGKRRKK